MAEPSIGLGNKLGSIAGKWAGYSALGTFLLYLFGYLALRFQFYAYGVSTNLDAFDEKYLFAGCRFVLFLTLTLPNILLILAVVLLPLHCLYRVTPFSWRSRLNAPVSHWFSRPYPLRLVGCVLALLLIQLLLRQCTLLSNLLLAEHPPESWISSVLRAGDFAQKLYFAGLMLGTGLSAGILVCALRAPTPPGAVSTCLTALLVLLVAVEFLLITRQLRHPDQRYVASPRFAD